MKIRLWLLAFLVAQAVATHGANLSLLDPAFLGTLQRIPTNNLVAWWKADSFVGLTNNAPVGDSTISRQWVDSSGNGYSLTNFVTGTEPTWAANQFTNSVGVKMPGVLFNGSQFFGVKPITNDNNVNFTLLVVLRQTAGNDGMVLGNATVNRQFRPNRSGANQWGFYDGTVEVVSTAYTLAITANKLSSCRRSAGATGTITFWENLTAKGTGTANHLTVYNQVGNSVGSIGTNPLNGVMAEMLIYNDALSDADLTALYNNYLKPRWGLP
jgi:hypothetical protein